MLLTAAFISPLAYISAITILSYYLHFRTSLVFSLLFSCLTLVLFRMSLPMSISAIFIYNAIPFIFDFLKEVAVEENNNLEIQFKIATEKYAHLLNEYASLKDANASLNRTATEMESSYEIARKMSEDLEFDKIFKTFNEFLSRKVEFKECKLLLAGKENDNVYIEKVYKMGHILKADEKDIKMETPELKDEIAIELFGRDQRPVFLSSDTEDRKLLKYFYPKEQIKTLVSNPLIVEDELIGVLLLEDLPEKDFDKFLILAGQFALEIKKVKLYEEIQKLAIIDGLTGVYMRRHFMERLEEEVKRCEYRGLKMSFLMLDIDHFKVCNDRYGHLVGDVALTEIANILKKNVREIDIICRYGGEEFAIALPDTDRNAALTVAERIRESVERHTFRAFGETPQLAVSVGVSGYPEDGRRPKQLIEASDKALYKAKHSGRNRVCQA